MPFKHQTESYRVIGGRKYICWEDVPWEVSSALASAIRTAGVPCRTFKMSDGTSRVFIPSEFQNRALPRWDGDMGVIIPR